MTTWAVAGAEEIARDMPDLLKCVDLDRIASQSTAIEYKCGVDDFGVASGEGRGESYVAAAQRSIRVRIHGIPQLLDFLDERQCHSDLVVDLLGGDGLIYRAARDIGRQHRIVTCDASPYIVAEARRQGVPALVQQAQDLVFRDGSVGGVLLAYGSHHIPPNDRPTVVSEAARVLEPGGVFVLHDFLVGSPTDAWFTEVVHQHAQTGHDYSHSGDGEIDALLRAQFATRRVVEIDDPFVTSGSTREEAKIKLGRYLVDMYGLVKLEEQYGVDRAGQWAISAAKSIFGVHVANDRASGRWTATMLRRAIVGVARKERATPRPELLRPGSPRVAALTPMNALPPR